MYYICISNLKIKIMKTMKITLGIFLYVCFIASLIYISISENEYVNLIVFFLGMFAMVAGLSSTMDVLEKNKPLYNRFKTFIETL